MKAQWRQLVQKIDAMSLRERGIIFCMLALAVVMLTDRFILAPQLARQKLLSQQIQENQSKMTAMRAEMLQKVKGQSEDPDAPNRERLAQLRKHEAQLNASLKDVQKGLVSPDRMSSLLEDILRRNGNLKMISLKTLPVSGIQDSVAANAKSGVEKATDALTGNMPPKADAPKAAPAKAELIYKHGVEITLQGGYLDMLKYLKDLESMPMQVFWGRAKLDADEYPHATLTLTLYTLSLEKKWLNL